MFTSNQNVFLASAPLRASGLDQVSSPSNQPVTPEGCCNTGSTHPAFPAVTTQQHPTANVIRVPVSTPFLSDHLQTPLHQSHRGGRAQLGPIKIPAMVWQAGVISPQSYTWG